MAKVNRGDTGISHDARLSVATPGYETALAEVDGKPPSVDILCYTDGNCAEWGFPVAITLNRDEALDLCSRILLRLKTPDLSELFPAAQRLDFGEEC